MAGDWIKYEKTTSDKPEVFEIASRLAIDPDAVVGKLLRVWSWFDDHSVDGNAPVTVTALLDRITGVTCFVETVISVGWMHSDGQTLTISNFTRHNGQTAKNRALTAERVSKSRQKCNADVTLAPLQKPLPEKRREEKSIDKSTPLPPKGGWQADQIQSQINSLFRRKASTPWSEKELRAYRKISFDPEDLEILTAYYLASIPRADDIRRRDIVTLLNNWPGEVDRARAFIEPTQKEKDYANSW